MKLDIRGKNMNTFDVANLRTEYRAAFHDMPVGDSMSGAAYGEYLKKKKKGIGMVIGVVAAVAAVFTGGLALAAYGAFGAAATAATAGMATAMGIGTVSTFGAISAGAMVAGGVMSGVGLVTGNEKLTKIGGVLTLAGGIGFAASNLVTQGAAAAGSTAGTQSEMLAAQTGEFGALGDAATKAALAPGDTIADATAKMLANDPGVFQAVPAQQVANAPAPAQAPAPAPAQAPVSVTEPVGIAPPAATPQVAPPAATPQVAPPAATPQVAPPAATPAATPADTGGVFGWMDKNKELVKTGGGLLKDVGGAMMHNSAGDKLTASDQAQADLINKHSANEGTVLILDPVNDRDYQRKKAEAIARGIPVIDMSPQTQAAKPMTATPGLLQSQSQ
jgi:hypothetical protein